MTRDFDDWKEIAEKATVKRKCKIQLEKLTSDFGKDYNKIGVDSDAL